MAMPTTTVEVAFATDPGATPTWTNISDYVKALSVRRGRPDEQAKYSAGQLTATLTNEDRRFDQEAGAATQYIDLPGTSGNYISTPDSAAIDVMTNRLTANQSSIETDASGWVADVNAPTLARSTAQFHSGAASLSMTATVAGDMTAQTTPITTAVVTPGETYRVSFYVRAASTVRGCVAGIRWYQSNGSTLISDSVGTAVTNSSTGWTLVTATATAPANAAYARVRVRVQGAALGEVHYIDSVSLVQGTGDIDIRVKVALDNWNTGVIQSLIDKRGINVGWQLRVNTAGNPEYIWGSGVANAFVSAPWTPPAAGATKWLRVTHDIDNGSNQNVRSFYQSDDGVNWTTIVASTGAGVAIIAESTAPPTLGADASGGFRIAGNVYYAEVRNGIDGPVVAKFDANTVPQTGTRTPSSWTSETGEVWTVNGTGWAWGGSWGSPYYPNVVPMRRIRVRATYGATTYDVFNGYVTNWRQVYAPPADAECHVEAADAFKVLANTTLLSSPYAAEVDADNPTLWWRLGDSAASNQALEQQAGARNLTPVGAPTFGAPSLTINDADGAITFPADTDGMQGVFPEGTWPFSTAGTMEVLYRADEATSIPNVVVAVVATLGAVNAGINIVRGTGPNYGFNVTVVNNAGTGYTVSTSGVDWRDLATHHIVVTVAASAAIKIYVDGVDRTASSVTFSGSMANTTDKWLAAINSYDYPPLVNAGRPSTYDELALYTSAVTAARATAHYNAGIVAWRGDRSGARVGRILDAIGWPAADRLIDTGMATLQSATLGSTALEALQDIEETEQGRLFVTADGKLRFMGRDTILKAPYTTSQATFGDSGSELEYGDLSYDDSDRTIINEAQVSRTNGSVQVVRDATSQTRYLRRTHVLSGLLHQDDSTSRDLAHWIVSHYKAPFRRATGVRLEPSAGNEATHFPHVLGRELVDRVTVVRRPQNVGAPINQDVNIEGITHAVTAMQWVTDWDLSPAETQIYWILGVTGFSELGATTRLGF